MRREELIMDILGELDEKLINEAMPRYSENKDDTVGAVYSAPEEPETVSRRDIRRYALGRALGTAAAAVLVVGAIVLLIMNWGQITVRDPKRPGVISSVGEDTVTASVSEYSELYTPCDLTYTLGADITYRTVHITGYEFDRLWCKIYFDLTYSVEWPGSRSPFELQIEGNDDSGETAYRFDTISMSGNTVSYTAEVFDLKCAKYSSDIIFKSYNNDGSFKVPVEYSGKIPTADYNINKEILTSSGKPVTLETISVCPYMFAFIYQAENTEDIEDIINYRVRLRNGEEIPVFSRRSVADDSGRVFVQVLTGYPTDMSDNDPQRINDRLINSDDISEIYVGDELVYSELIIPTGRVQKTFDIIYEYKNYEPSNNTPIVTYLDQAMASDGAGYRFVCSYPIETFLKEISSDQDTDVLAGLLEPYADSQMLSLEKIRNSLPGIELYHRIDDDVLYSSEYGAYALGDEYVIYITDALNVFAYKKSGYYSELRRGIEILWANFDRLRPLTVTAVSDKELTESEAAEPKLEISADKDELELIKNTFEAAGIHLNYFIFTDKTWEPVYDDIFKGFDNNPITVGDIIDDETNDETYDETMNEINIDDIDSFYRIRIIDLIPENEAKNIKGWNSLYGDDEHIFYKAQKVEDLLTGESADEIIYYSTYGNVEYQTKGNPPYMPGDEIATVLLKKEADSDVTRPFASYLLAVDVKVGNNAGLMGENDEKAYKRNDPLHADGFTGYTDIFSLTAVTSTTQNPVKYVQTIDLKQLAEFYKNDWANRSPENRNASSDPFEQITDTTMPKPFASDDEDRKSFTTGYAPEYSVIVGDNEFSPMWFYYHTAEDYKAAGIEPNKMHSLLEKYGGLGLTDEAWREFRKKLIIYAYSNIYKDNDRVYTYDADIISEPLDDRAFEILENVFYGEWENAGNNDLASPYMMTYNNGSLNFGKLLGIYETDDIWVIHYHSGGGTLACFVIEKNDPDTMYMTDVYPSLSGVELVILNDNDTYTFINRRKVTPVLEMGAGVTDKDKIGILGLTYLFHIYGSDFEKFYYSVINKDMYTSISDTEGIWLSDGYTVDEYTRYLVGMTETSVDILLPYVKDKEKNHQTPINYRLHFEKDENGEWSVEHIGAGDVPAWS